MRLKYYVVDAFAEQTFEGSPTGIVVVDGEWPSDECMLNMTKENAFPETAFIRKEDEGYFIRWFALTGEIDLCGHATLASAYVVKRFLDPETKLVKFSSGSGPLQVEVKDDGLLEMVLPVRMPEPIELTDELVEALGGTVPKESYRSRDYFFELEDEEAVKNLKPDYSAMSKLDYGDGVIVTAKGSKTDFVTRAFFPKLLTDEDYVCGSAHCNLVPYWAKKMNKTSLLSRQYSSRGAYLHCKLDGDCVRIAGSASLYCIAEIYLDD